MRKLKAFTLIFLLLVIPLSQTACGDRELRQYLRDAVTVATATAKTILNTLPPDDPKRPKVQEWLDALIRFDVAFNSGTHTDEELLAFWADVVSGFSAAISPYLAQGGAVAIAVIALETALRIFATRFEKKFEKQIKEAAARSAAARSSIDRIRRWLDSPRLVAPDPMRDRNASHARRRLTPPPLRTAPPATALLDPAR